MPAEAKDVASRLRAHGWRCGSVVAATANPRVLPYLKHFGADLENIVSAEDWLVVITHTCDLYAVSGKSDPEPIVEILLCRPVRSKPDSTLRNRRSTRKIHFRPQRVAAPTLWLGCHATIDRFVIPRELLAEQAPATDRILDEQAVKQIQSWLALRCERPSWPDELVKRLAARYTDFVDALKPLDDDYTEVRVTIEAPSEESAPFVLTVFLVIDETIWHGDPGARANAVKAFGQFLSALRKAEGILVHDDSAPVSGGEFSWQLMQMTEIWNFANLTPMD